MDIQLETVDFDADKKLVEFVNEKVAKLNQYFDQIISSAVHLKLSQTTEAENKIAEIKLLVPGKELFAKKQCKSFEEATDLCVDALRRQVTKHKEKMK